MSNFSLFPFPIPAKEQFYACDLNNTKWNDDPPVHPYTWGRVPGIRNSDHLVLAPHRALLAEEYVAPDVAEALRLHNESLIVNGAFYDVTALFRQIFATHDLTEITLVNEIELYFGFWRSKTIGTSTGSCMLSPTQQIGRRTFLMSWWQ